MAITFALITDRPTLKRWRVTATLDADFEGTVAHGMELLPGFDDDNMVVIAQGVEGNTGDGAAALSLWRGEVQFNDPTLLLVTKETTAGSGSAGYQLELTAMLPHSIL